MKEKRDNIKGSIVEGKLPTIQVAGKEIQNGLDGLLGLNIPEVDNVYEDEIILVGALKKWLLLQDIDLK